jgi:hypothetical protein
MTLGVIVSLFGLGTALVLLFTLAIYAMPFFVGLTVGMWAFETGAGVIGAALVGLVAGVVALFAAQLLFASVRSLALRAAAQRRTGLGDFLASRGMRGTRRGRKSHRRRCGRGARGVSRPSARSGHPRQRGSATPDGPRRQQAAVAAPGTSAMD